MRDKEKRYRILDGICFTIPAVWNVAVYGIHLDIKAIESLGFLLFALAMFTSVSVLITIGAAINVIMNGVMFLGSFSTFFYFLVHGPFEIAAYPGSIMITILFWIIMIFAGLNFKKAKWLGIIGSVLILIAHLLMPRSTFVYNRFIQGKALAFLCAEGEKIAGCILMAAAARKLTEKREPLAPDYV